MGTPINEFMALLEQHTTLTEIAEATGMSRATMSRLRNDTKITPQPSTRRAIEDACQMPRGTVTEVIDGQITPSEGAARYGRVGAALDPDLEFRIRNLEATAETVRALAQRVEELTRRLEDRG